jgi:hypothetical protein
MTYFEGNAMFAKMIGMTLVFSFLSVCGLAAAQEPKTSSKIIGEVKSLKNSKDGKNTSIEVLAPGEEKARSYHVNYDPKIKGPNPKVLSAVRHAKVGERVELDWIGTNHGPAITAFKVLKKDSKAEK